MAVNAECLHFAHLIITFSTFPFEQNLVSQGTQVQKRWVTTDFTLTLTLYKQTNLKADPHFSEKEFPQCRRPYWKSNSSFRFSWNARNNLDVNKLGQKLVPDEKFGS